MEARRRALGRGLGALLPAPGAAAAPLPEPAATPADGPRLREVEAERISPNPYQPRTEFDESALAELAASIREQGLLQPLVVRPVGDRFELIAGERRFRAAQRAGLSRIPVVLRTVTDRDMLELALIENLQRENLNALEEARSFERLIDEFGLTQEEVAKRVGKSRSVIANAVRLLALPAEVQDQIARGEITAGHARGLLALGSADAQRHAAKDVIDRKLTVRDVEKLAQGAPAKVDPEQASVEAELSHALGTRVRVRPGRGAAGRIEISYYSLEELNGLIARLSDRREASGF